MNSIRDTVRFYDKEASQYDTSRYQTQSGQLWNQLQLCTVRNLVSRAALKKPVIMDLACGTGRFGINLAPDAAFVFAVDQSDRMLEIAQRKSESKGFKDKFSFIKSDVGQINTESDTVDLVLCLNAFGHLPHLSKVFREVSRVLKSNGYFIFNYPNLSSFYYPLGFWITRKKRSLIKDVYTRWLGHHEIDTLRSKNNFTTIASLGLLLPTAFPIAPFHKTRLLGRSFNNKAIVRLSPIVFDLVQLKK